MNKSLLIETANVCLAAFPPLVGFYGVCPAFTQWFLQDQARAFLLGFALGLRRIRYRFCNFNLTRRT